MTQADEIRRRVVTGMPVVQSHSTANPRTGKFAPVTLGHMRSQGCRDLLVYCNSGRCNHRTTMLLGQLPDDTPIKSLGYVIVCERCGHLGARVVPNWPAQTTP
jgi:hypothetical protein